MNINKIEWLKYEKGKCVLIMKGYDDLYSTDYKTLSDVLDKRLLGKYVKPIYPKEESYLPDFLYTHKCKYEIMDTGRHKGHYVVRSTKDRSKFWHVTNTSLYITNEVNQLNIFDIEG